MPSANDVSNLPPRHSDSHRSQQLVHMAQLISKIRRMAKLSLSADSFSVDFSCFSQQLLTLFC